MCGEKVEATKTKVIQQERTIKQDKG